MPGTAGAHHTQPAGTVGGKFLHGQERLPQSSGWRRANTKGNWMGSSSVKGCSRPQGAAAANEQVPQARVRAEEQGKDQSTAINRGRRNRGDTDPCKLQDGKTISNTAPGTHAWESVMQSQVQTKLSPHSEIQ